MNNRSHFFSVAAFCCGLGLTLTAWADPCGMVPPIYQGDGVPITRVGEQMTYVFFKDGMETLVIRPGFEGQVDEFGMLIPFPTPPAIRKVPDTIFPHIAAAIDPPEVVVYLGPQVMQRMASNGPNEEMEMGGLGLQVRDEVRVLREEAVGMYEVAVLEAGSSNALSRWMGQHGYRYPEGMDHVCDDYVSDGWCFVAVKTRVGLKSGADPAPGQTATNTKMPPGSTFDGHVQAMGFRFKVDELVVPMRLSAFNEGELRNVVYLLTDRPRRIRNIPEEYVVRQVAGKKLYDNVTRLLPLRVVGGHPRDRLRPAPWVTQGLAERRDPHHKNGAAKELFAADLMAVTTGNISLPQEELEKGLLNISEHLELRGPEIDTVLADATKQARQRLVRRALRDLEGMTLTVVDGDFPRDVVAGQNLTFAEYRMPKQRNRRSQYDAKLKRPAEEQPGEVIDSLGRVPREWKRSSLGMVPLVAGMLVLCRRRMRRAAALSAFLLCWAHSPIAGFAEDEAEEANVNLAQLIDSLAQPEQAVAAMNQLVERSNTTVENQSHTIHLLRDCVESVDDLPQQGWAIVALSRIPTLAADQALLEISNDTTQSQLVRTWAAAGRVALCRSTEAVMERASLVQYFPAVARPISLRLAAELSADGDASVAELIQLTLRTPALMQSLMPAILAKGVSPLVATMVSDPNQETRRQAAGFLGSLAKQGQTDAVAEAVAEAYSFAAEADEVPWDGGPLFIPGIRWEPDPARQLVGHLIRWHLWCGRHHKSEQQQQINNNLVSLQLARAAGYSMHRRGRKHTSAEWIKAWETVVGRAEINQLLSEQGLNRRTVLEGE